MKKLSVSYRCVLTEPPWSIQRPQVEHREPLKCLIQGGGRMEKARRREGVRDTEKDVITSFHLLLRVGVKGVTENR